jgi:hypothetical protein
MGALLTSVGKCCTNGFHYPSHRGKSPRMAIRVAWRPAGNRRPEQQTQLVTPLHHSDESQSGKSRGICFSLVSQIDVKAVPVPGVFGPRSCPCPEMRPRRRQRPFPLRSMPLDRKRQGWLVWLPGSFAPLGNRDSLQSKMRQCFVDLREFRPAASHCAVQFCSHCSCGCHRERDSATHYES